MANTNIKKALRVAGLITVLNIGMGIMTEGYAMIEDESEANYKAYITSSTVKWRLTEKIYHLLSDIKECDHSIVRSELCRIPKDMGTDGKITTLTEITKKLTTLKEDISGLSYYERVIHNYLSVIDRVDTLSPVQCEIFDACIEKLTREIYY